MARDLSRVREALVRQGHLGARAEVFELHGDEGLAAVVSGVFPLPGVDEALGWADLAEGPGEVEGLALGWGHAEAVAAAGAQIDLGERAGEAGRAPPVL